MTGLSTTTRFHGASLYRHGKIGKKEAGQGQSKESNPHIGSLSHHSRMANKGEGIGMEKTKWGAYATDTTASQGVRGGCKIRMK